MSGSTSFIRSWWEVYKRCGSYGSSVGAGVVLGGAGAMRAVGLRELQGLCVGAKKMGAVHLDLASLRNNVILP